jgi:hypothetical protein
MLAEKIPLLKCEEEQRKIGEGRRKRKRKRKERRGRKKRMT